MATLFVDATTDYRNNLPFGNITDLTFTNDDAVAFARFDRSQFQPGLVSNTLHVTGSGPLTNVVHVYMQVANGAFSAAGWTFSDWGPEDYALFSGTTGNDTITGSSGADNIANGGGTDELHGGGGADILQINAQPLAGSLLDGGSQLIGTRDMLNIFVLGTTDLRQTTITSVEELGFVRDDQVFVLAGNQIGFGAIGTVANHFMDNLTLSVRGDSIDLRTVTFTGWTASCTVELRGTALADALYGSSQNDRLNGLASGADTLAGGAGNDTYVNPVGATITEQAGEGNDTVESLVSFSLETLANVERLFLTGAGATDGTGNTLANQIIGSTGNNTLSGLAGADTLNGGAGGDTLSGGAGADRLTGGTQRDKYIPGVDGDADTLVFSILNDSTGVTRDILDRIDFNAEDRIDLPGTVSAIRAQINGGALSTASFNADLAAAVTAAKLGAGQAVLFDPSGGNQDLANTVYLIVDANGVAGYQANADWVFQLENHTGTLDPTDFI